MHGWGVTRGMSHASHLSRSRLPLMHTYAAITSESSPLPPYTPPLSTPASRSLPLQLLLALFTTLVVLSSLLQVAGLHNSLRYVDDSTDTAAAAPTQLFALQQQSTAHDLSKSAIYQDILERLEATDIAKSTEGTDADADLTFVISFNGVPVSDGAVVPVNEAESAPSIAIEYNDIASVSAARFTWVLVDIDAPDPHDPTHAPFLHYIVADLDVGTASLQQQPHSRILVPYYPVSPPTGEHRYVSLLFRQVESLSSEALEAKNEKLAQLSDHRMNFNVAAFAEAHALVLVRTAYFVSPHERRDA